MDGLPHQLRGNGLASGAQLLADRADQQPAATRNADTDASDSSVVSVGSAEQDRFGSPSSLSLDVQLDGLVSQHNLFSFAALDTYGHMEGHMIPQSLDDSILYDTIALTPISEPVTAKNPRLERSNNDDMRDLFRPTPPSSSSMLSNPCDFGKQWREASTFSDIDDMISAASGCLDGELATAAGGPPCSCPTSLSKLQLFVANPGLPPEKASIPLDFLLFLEETIYRTHKTLAECVTCGPISLHSLASMCICTDWVVEALKNVIQRWTSVQQRCHGSEEGPCSPLTSEGYRIRVGRLCLDEDLWEICVQHLIKHRLARFAAVIENMAHAGHGETAPLSQAVTTMARDVHYKMESMRGMIELWESVASA